MKHRTVQRWYEREDGEPPRTSTGERLSFVRSRNDKRRASKSARNYGVKGRRGDAVRAMPCLTTRSRRRLSSWCRGKIEASHAIPRGMGGVKGDATKLVPHCEACHLWFGHDPRGYERATGLSVRAEAARIAAELDESLGPEPCYLCEENPCSPLCKRRRTERVR